jgi:GNAT superfamily N-acetyltransferase
LSITIRACRPEDAPVLREIEWIAGQRFRDVGMDDVADHEPTSVDRLVRYAIAGRAWAAVTERDEVVGYVLVDEIDGNAHVEQISVRPDHQGAGVGRALLDRVGTWARDGGRPAITLTTFATVAWNGPLYRHLGFAEVAERVIVRSCAGSATSGGCSLLPDHPGRGVGRSATAVRTFVIIKAWSR